jgi:excisionase family DNA binding protein
VADLKKLVTVPEASAATWLSKSMIYKLVYTKVLQRVRLPGCNKLLIAESDVQRYIDEGVKAGAIN